MTLSIRADDDDDEMYNGDDKGPQKVYQRALATFKSNIEPPLPPLPHA